MTQDDILKESQTRVGFSIYDAAMSQRKPKSGSIDHDQCFDIELVPRSIIMLRLSLGFSQEELGSIAGVSRNYIAALETGNKRKPSEAVLAKLEDALNVRFIVKVRRELLKPEG